MLWIKVSSKQFPQPAHYFLFRRILWLLSLLEFDCPCNIINKYDKWLLNLIITDNIIGLRYKRERNPINKFWNFHWVGLNLKPRNPCRKPSRRLPCLVHDDWFSTVSCALSPFLSHCGTNYFWLYICVNLMRPMAHMIPHLSLDHFLWGNMNSTKPEWEWRKLNLWGRRSAYKHSCLWGRLDSHLWGKLNNRKQLNSWGRKTFYNVAT